MSNPLQGPGPLNLEQPFTSGDVARRNAVVPEPEYAGLSTERRKALNDFVEEIRAILVNGHREYGETAEAIYSALGPAACGYAVAEKGIRYARKGNKNDLVKAATYAFLGWTVAK